MLLVLDKDLVCLGEDNLVGDCVLAKKREKVAVCFLEPVVCIYKDKGSSKSTLLVFFTLSSLLD